MTIKWNIDATNIALMLISCALAYVLPFELVLLSYAFLGPAHYLTQISWMHDRGYFVGKKWLWIPASILTLALIVVIFGAGAEIPAVYAIYAIALAGAIALTFTKKLPRILLIIAGVFGALMGLSMIVSNFAEGLTILLPTVIHIYVFTGAFIIFGALKSNSRLGLVSFGVFIACAAAFFIISPPYNMVMPSYVANGIGMFEGVADYLADVLSFGGWIDSHAMLGFLSFAYTYHYLNWFSKAEVIKWHEMSKLRLAVIVALYLAAIGIYIYDYQTGLLTLLFLSLLHVFLEFPLNVLTFKDLGGRALATFKKA